MVYLTVGFGGDSRKDVRFFGPQRLQAPSEKLHHRLTPDLISKTTHQELWAALRQPVQVSLHVNQVLVYAIQVHLQLLVLQVVPVKLSFVAQTLVFINDGWKQTAEGHYISVSKIPHQSVNRWDQSSQKVIRLDLMEERVVVTEHYTSVYNLDHWSQLQKLQKELDRF